MSSQPLPAPANQLFRYLFEQASLGIAVEDIEGKILLANPALSSMLGYTEQELRTMNCSQFANPEDSQDDWAFFQQLRAGVIDHYSLEKRYIKKDGARIWGRLNVSLLKEGDGGTPLVFAFVEEITERKFVEQELIRSNERFRLAAKAGKVYAYDWDPASDAVTRSGEYVSILGIAGPEAQPTRQQVAARVHPDDRARFIRSVDHLAPENPTTQISYRLLRSDGSVIWLEKSGRAFFDAQGRLLRVMGMVADITERKQAEEALRQKDKELAEAQRLAGIGSWVWDARTDETTWSKEIYLRVGRDPGLPAPRLREHANLFSAESWDRLQRAVEKAVQTGTPYELDLEIISPKSTTRWVVTRGKPVRDAGGQIIGLRGTVQDITERKRAEEALRESEQRLRLAIQAGRMYAFDWNVATDVIVRSKESVEILNWEKPETDTGKAFHARIHPDDLALYTAMEARLTPEDPTYRIIFRTLNPAGSVIWLEDSGRAFFDGQGTLIRVIGVVADITERKQAQEELHESEERFRLAAQAGKMFAYEWDAATDKIVRSEGVRQILGVDAGAHITGQEILTMVPPEDRARLIAAIAQLSPEEPHLRISYRMVRSNGSVIWVERTSRAYFDEHGRMLRMVGMIADITERKRQEAVLRESEERFRLVADTAPTLIWMSGTDKLCTYFNKLWLDFTGRSMDSELGNGLVKGVHPEDLQRCLETYTRSFDRREKFRMEYQLRGYDGEYRWILDIGVPRFNADGSFAGYIGSCIDVTENKLAEATLANVSRKLIEAQEQERMRIGRELHDDIGQRLALLAVELQQLREHALTMPRVRSRIGKLQKQVSEVARDTQSLSHELHSAKLQYLGLAAAMRGFCREFGERQKVEVDFKAHDLPSALSSDISLCLFRVLQEALHNSAKHSGVRHFEVRLWGTSDEIHLTVKDSGMGFDREAAKESPGLGLISMEERLRLVKGTLSIESRLKRGTTIHARVRVGWASDSVRAAG